MTYVLAIDPGNTQSAYALVGEAGQPVEVDKVENDTMRRALPRLLAGHRERPFVAIEMVASYGMPVGADVFETCVWIGRFDETVRQLALVPPRLVYRRDVKLHHCGNTKAKDANITQALIDRFAPGQPNRGKGTKSQPGWFYGFRADIWQAYALAVYIADRQRGVQGVA